MCDVQKENFTCKIFEKNLVAEEPKYDEKVSGIEVKTFNGDENSLIQEDDYINAIAKNEYNDEKGENYHNQENNI